MRLYVDPRSSASLRVLTYLDHKGLAPELVALDLFAGEQRHEGYAALNPSCSVPALDLGEQGVVTQSLAILELLEAWHPEPPALPPDELGRARVRALCGLIGADIHPLTNLRVRLEVERLAGEAASPSWVRRWTEAGLATVDAWLARHGGRFSVGDAVTLADFFVAPLAFNARRLGQDLGRHARLARVFDHCLDLPAFERLRQGFPTQFPRA